MATLLAIKKYSKVLLKKINSLELWHIAVIFGVIGLATHFTGLSGAFQGDDSYQIVNNIPVHSISNFFEFFKSSTFYNGQSLVGIYYRPLMTVTFSFIYSLFGAHPLAYHLVQLLLYSSGAFVLFMVFKHFFKKQALALLLALIFLVHPLNSQVVYSIPTMQDALFFFFGIVAIWILIQFKTPKAMAVACACLLLSLFSKESAVVFVAMAALYLFLFERKRMLNFAVVMTPTFIVYLFLKISAVGFSNTQHAAPIDDIGLAGRLFTTPSIVKFFLTKFVYPQKLALGYYWVNSSFSVRHVLLPLLFDLAVIGLVIYMGFRVRQRLSKANFSAFIFFTSWIVIGVLPYMQIIPLDMTVCETWFYFSMAGLLGVIGLSLMTIKIRLQPQWLIICGFITISLLGIRTALRGNDYQSQYKLAVRDISVSENNYSALSNISQYYIGQAKYKEATDYAKRSIDAYPVVSNYINLGVALQQTGDYPGAIAAYNQSLKYGNLSIIYENLGLISLVYGEPVDGIEFIQKSLQTHPNNFKLWVYLALLQDAHGDNKSAQVSISNALKLGQVPQIIYVNIMYNRPFTVPILDKTLVIN